MTIAADYKKSGSLLVVFNNDIQMSELNFKFKGKRKPTDVLAFNLADNSATGYIDGEVYVGLQTAARQAAEYNVDYLEEIIRLCVHGFLHLLGFSDLNISDKKNMWQIQEKYISRFLEKEN